MTFPPFVPLPMLESSAAGSRPFTPFELSLSTEIYLGQTLLSPSISLARYVLHLELPTRYLSYLRLLLQLDGGGDTKIVILK